MAVTLNASTSTGYIQTADTSGDLALQSNGTTQFTVSSTGAYGQIKSGTAVSPTTSTSVEFTNLPSWVKRITLMLSGVSASSTGIPIIQLGTGSTPTYTTSGYLGSGIQLADGASVNGATVTTGIQIRSALAASLLNGAVTLSLLTGNTWVAHGAVSDSSSARGYLVASSIPLGAALTAVRLFIDGTQQFDAGTINILYEG